MLEGRESFTCGAGWLTGLQPWSLKTAAVCWNYRAQWLTLFLCLRPLGSASGDGTSPHSKTGSPQRNCWLIKITNSLFFFATLALATWKHLLFLALYVDQLWEKYEPKILHTGRQRSRCCIYEAACKNKSSRPPKMLLWFLFTKLHFHNFNLCNAASLHTSFSKIQPGFSSLDALALTFPQKAFY